MLKKFRDGVCGCGSINRIVKYLPSVGLLCDKCNEERLGKDKPVRPSFKSVRKPTGEAALFASIWDARLHRSFVSGAPLGDEMVAHYFAHVLPKGTYGKFRLYDRNIVLLTAEEHHLFDFARHKVADNPLWQPIFRLEEELKREYYASGKQKRGFLSP